MTADYDNIFIKGDRNRQLRSNHQKGHVNKDGVYIKHTDMKGKKKPRAPKTDKLPRKPDFNNRGGQQPRGNNPTRPGMDFSMGMGNRQPPKIPTGMNMPPQGIRPQLGVQGLSGNVPPPSMNRPPGVAPPSNLPPLGSNVPPMGGAPGFRPPYQNPLGMPPQQGGPQVPPTGNMPPRMGPVPGSQYVPKSQAPPSGAPQGQRPPE